jgi:endonuclease/exonuclease/phosphatase (EEP) superfamily protein YafD
MTRRGGLIVRIVTYNFRAGGTAARDAWPALGALQPDVLLGQECRKPPPGNLRGAWVEAAERRWGTGLFLRERAVRRIEIKGFEGWVCGVKLPRRDWLTERPLRVFSVHCPGRGGSYVKTMHQILDAIAPHAVGMDVVLGGDFNVAAGMRRQTDKVRTSNGERQLLQRLKLEFKLMACWQAMHPRQKLAQTLRWNGNPITPYHCDGIFAPRAWRKILVRCEVIAGPEWDKLSDHNPVVADFA